MAYGLTLVFEGVNEEQYWSVNEKLGIGRDGKGDYPPGLLVHSAGPRDSGWAVIEVWDSKDAQATFMETRLGAALDSAGVAPPSQVIDIDTVNLQLPG